MEKEKMEEVKHERKVVEYELMKLMEKTLQMENELVNLIYN